MGRYKNMATIALTSPSSPSSSFQHNRVTVASLYSWNMSDRASSRDIIDMLLAVLRCALKHSKTRNIRNAAEIRNYKRVQYFIAILCRFGLLTEESITKRSRTKNKTTGRHEIRTIRRYYVTPKGHTLIRLYDVMVDQLVNF